jgi:hypothetical protein
MKAIPNAIIRPLLVRGHIRHPHSLLERQEGESRLP